MPPSPTAGSFTAAQLQKVIAKIDTIWADNQTKRDYESNVEALRVLRAEQTARLTEIENPEKDKVIKIIWIADCNTGVSECEDDADLCDFTGAEAEARSQDYALDICGSVKFSIEDNVFRTSEFSREEVLAKQMLKRMRELDEWLTQKVVAKLNTYVGVNQYEGFMGTVDGVQTYILANYWSPDMYGYFNQVAIMNKFRNPYMLHGSNLFQTNWLAQQNQVDANGKAAPNKLLSMRSYWDLFNIDAINAPDKVSYMIEKGSIAFANKAYYPLNSPQTYQFGKRWSIESKALPGVYYDVYYKERCVMVDGVEKVYHDYKITVKAGLFLNPLGCNEDITGIIKFLCVTTIPAES